jgi:SAM-dependent methyltransferase
MLSQPEHNEYLLGHSMPEEDRLRRQAREFVPDSTQFLDQLGIQPGWRTADIGCGPHGILDLLSERVGPNGRVVGVERSESTVQLALQMIADRQLWNVEMVHADASATGLPRASFNLVHARLLLVNLPEPRKIVDEMIALVRPGGIVAAHEGDWGISFCHPPSPAWDRFLGAFEAFSRNKGIDLRIGRKLPEIFRAAGLIDVQVTPIIHCEPLGTGRRNILCDLVENLRDGLITQGLLTEIEIKEQLTDLKRHLNDANTLVIPHLFLQVWGRKPE